MIIGLVLVLASVTFNPKPCMHCANGRTWGANERRYGNICAMRGGHFGDDALVRRGGRRVRATIVDRPDAYTDCDLSVGAFRQLAALKVGRIQASVRIVRRAGR